MRECSILLLSNTRKKAAPADDARVVPSAIGAARAGFAIVRQHAQNGGRCSALFFPDRAPPLAAIALLAIAWNAQAQLDVHATIGGVERRATGSLNLGETATGEPLEIRFRVENTGDSIVTVSTLRIEGAGYALTGSQTPPFFIASGTSASFFVRYQSEAVTSGAPGVLRVNSGAYSLMASTTAAPAVYAIALDGAETRRLAGQATVFATVERGAGPSRRRFVIRNSHNASFPMTLEGADFRWPPPLAGSILLLARETRSIEIEFAPATSGSKLGALVIGSLGYPVEGVAREPAPPRPRVQVDSSLRSGAQARVAVLFEAASRGQASGQLRVEFEAGVAGPDDPAIVFSNGRRSIPFTLREGDSQAMFGESREAIVQTGTTAGRLRFIAEAGGFTAQAESAVAPAAVTVDSVTGQRHLDLLELTVRGFDNTRTVSEIAFTFYNRDGQAIPPGELRQNVADKFRRYFETTPAGGMFALHAVFPATGSTQSIAAVEIELRNRVGAEKTRRIPF